MRSVDELLRAGLRCRNRSRASSLPGVAWWLAACFSLLAFAVGLTPGRQATAQSQFSFAQAGTVTPVGGWEFVTGDFVPGGPSEIMGYHPSNGTLWVGIFSGSGFSLSQWVTVTPAAGWSFVAGDFVPGGGTDLAGYHPSNGTLWVGVNSGSGFQFSARGSVTPAADWSFVAGDFVPGGGTDLAGYHPSNGTLWVGTNTGSGFSFDEWATVTPAAGWTFVAGDFVPGGDGTDLAGYHPSNGTLWVGTNTEGHFSFNRWAEITPVAGWSFATGDFVPGGGTDLAGYHPSNGTLWVGTNTRCGGFEFSQAATVAPVADWRFAGGEFSGDGRTDLLGYHPGNGTLWIGRSTGAGQPAGTLEGYAWPLSGAPGEKIGFRVSGEGSTEVRFFRHKANAAGVTSVPMGATTFASAIQPVGPTPWRLGAGWGTSFSLTIPDDWPSGIYSAALTGRDGADFHVPFVVRPDPAERSGLAVLANVNTWLAYNDWGCAGKYGGAAQVSFLRPNIHASPVGEGPGPYHLARGELWILGWLEDDGRRPDVYTDLDFHNGLLAGGYDALVVGTHPEYWTNQMLDRLRAYLSGGGSLLYLGGNGIYENGEYTADQTGMVFRAGVENGPRADALFRRLPAGSERAVLGVATERCGVLGAGYHAEVPGHPFFQGTGLTGAPNETFGDQGLNTGFGNGGASAWEVDTSDRPGATGIPIDCGTEELPVPPPPALPPGLVVLAKGRNIPGPGAEMITYDHPEGGLVFSVGSLTFGGSLVVDPVLQRIMRNVLAEVASR